MLSGHWGWLLPRGRSTITKTDSSATVSPLHKKAPRTDGRRRGASCFALSVDLDDDFLVMAGRSSTHHNADRFGDAPLLADHMTHVGLRYFEVVHHGAILPRGGNGHLHGLLVFHKAAGDGQ